MEQQIIELNARVKTYLAPSKIHGIGVFALRDIGKDQKLYADAIPKPYKVPYSSFGKLFPEVAKELLDHWATIAAGSHFYYPTTSFQSYMNHSENPNYDCQKDITVRDIKKDEEITEDYRVIKGSESVYKWLDIKKMV